MRRSGASAGAILDARTGPAAPLEAHEAGGQPDADEGAQRRPDAGDARVVDRAHALWPLLVAMMPFNGAVFALDGILIGAGDTRYLAVSMVVAGFVFYVPVALLALHFEWGITGVWCGLLALMAVRLATLGARFRSRRWAVVGAPAAPA